MLTMGGPSHENKSDTNKQINGLNHNYNKSNITSIAACHSHRNVKSSHQMLIAESLYDPNIKLDINSRLSRNLEQMLNDNNVLPYFIQFLEAKGTTSKHLIRFWIQTECLKRSQKDIDNSQMTNEQDYKKQFINDAINIYEKCISPSGLFNINLPDSIAKEIHEKLYLNKTCDSDLFENSQKYVMSLIESNYFSEFLKSVYFCKYQVEVLTSDKVFLTDVLFNDFRLATDFIEFMEAEKMRRYIDFLIIIDNYKKTVQHYDDAHIILNKFFSSTSPDFLEFSDSINNYVKENIENNYDICFDKPTAILIQYFEKTYLRQFLQSEIYYDYLSHCIASINNEANLMGKKFQKNHRRTGSESSISSESSYVSSIDGLTDPSPKFRHKHLLTDQNPESLWKRDLSGKLQIAHIDQYGKVIRQFEPQPKEEKSKNTLNISKAMKLFSSTNSSDEKDKEEMAWQVAQMIVNDVCKITLDKSSINSNKSSINSNKT